MRWGLAFHDLVRAPRTHIGPARILPVQGIIGETGVTISGAARSKGRDPGSLSGAHNPIPREKIIVATLPYETLEWLAMQLAGRHSCALRSNDTPK
jgi:hypothetical protein